MASYSHGKRATTRAGRIAPFILVALTLVGGCDVARGTVRQAFGEPRISIEETLEYDARKAGFQDGDLKRVVESALNSEGILATASPANSNVEVHVQLRILDLERRGYAGMALITVREPVTMWSTGNDAMAISAVNSLVFTSSPQGIREYVLGNLHDAVMEVVRKSPGLTAGRGKVQTLVPIADPNE